MTLLRPIVTLRDYLLPTMRDTPAEAEIVSHRLMLRAGMIQQETAGIYSWLPLGFRVLKKIEQIVREEQDRIGHETLMPTLQPADIWRQSGRYDDYGKEMLRIKDRHDRDLLYGPTNEEMITRMMAAHVKSYKDLPMMLYHIQWKFRDEIRPRFGVMRGREFLMKDAYSFDFTPEAGQHSYNRQFITYLRTYARLGLKAVPMAAETGPIGGKLSHEFIILAETGESAIWCDKMLLEQNLLQDSLDLEDAQATQAYIDQLTQYYAATDDQHDEKAFIERVPEERRTSARGVEVGHIFFFGDKYSVPLGANVSAKDGSLVPLLSGSYGIGVSRLLGAVIEASHDESGIIWPKSIAPFHAGIILIKPDDPQLADMAMTLAHRLVAAGLDVMIDDRDERVGVKYADLELIGLPFLVTIGPRGAARGMVEVKARTGGEERQELSLEAAINFMLDQKSGSE